MKQIFGMIRYFLDKNYHKTVAIFPQNITCNKYLTKNSLIILIFDNSNRIRALRFYIYYDKNMLIFKISGNGQKILYF